MPFHPAHAFTAEDLKTWGAMLSAWVALYLVLRAEARRRHDAHVAEWTRAIAAAEAAVRGDMKIRGLDVGRHEKTLEKIDVLMASLGQRLATIRGALSAMNHGAAGDDTQS